MSRSNVVLPYINGKLICSAFRLCIHFNKKMTLMTGFVVQGHIFQNVLHHLLVTPTDTFFPIFAINKYSFTVSIDPSQEQNYVVKRKGSSGSCSSWIWKDIEITVAEHNWNAVSQNPVTLHCGQSHSASRRETNIGAMDRCWTLRGVGIITFSNWGRSVWETTAETFAPTSSGRGERETTQE